VTAILPRSTITNSQKVSLPADDPDNVVRRDYSNHYIAYMILAVHLAAETAEDSSNTTVSAGNTHRNGFFMDQFIKNTLHTLHIPNFPPQDASNRALKILTALRRPVTLLLVGYSYMSKGSFDNIQLEHFERLVSEVMEQIRTLRSSPDMMTTSSHRHQMTTAVAATLLISGALIYHTASKFELRLQRMRYDVYMKCFKECASGLGILAKSLPYARRVHNECAALIDIGAILSGRLFGMSYSNHGGHNGHFLVESSLATFLAPIRNRSFDDMFPFQTGSPNLQGAIGSSDDLFGVDRGKGSGVLWLL